MRKVILIIAALAFITASCGSNNKEASDQEKKNTPEAEASYADSVSVELNEAKKEIEESAEKLDELVNDL